MMNKIATSPPIGNSEGPYASVALAAYDAGLSPIPAWDKRPIPRGCTGHDAKRPPRRTIEKWIKRYSSANIGTGPQANLTVVDIDDADLLDTALRTFGDAKAIVRTPNGYHLYYRFAGEQTKTRLEGAPIDIRADGGFLILPPSTRDSISYEWERGSLETLQDLTPANSLPIKTDHPQLVAGERNTGLFQKALREVSSCDHFDALLDVYQTWNADLIEPLPDREVKKSAKSVWKMHLEGRIWVGQEARAVSTRSMLEAFCGDGNAHYLYCHLKAAHGWRNGRPFAIANQFAESLGWSVPKFRRVRERLEAMGYIRRVWEGGGRANDPHLYVLTGEGT